MDDTEATRLEQIRAFLAGSGEVRFAGQRREEVYSWVERTLVRLQYTKLRQTWQGIGPAVPLADDGAEPGAGDALDCAQTPHGAGESSRLSADQVRHALHGCRRESACLCGQGARELKWTSDVTDPRSGAQRLRASSVCAAGVDFGGAPLPAAQQLRPTGNATPVISPRGQPRFPSASGANRNRAANRDSCASTPYIRAINKDAKVYITSMRSTK